jgi:cytochrome d ubiquinol oxidase subunit II
MASVWYGVLVFMLTGYAVLDGFDLGVGVLHLWIGRDDRERRTAIAAIGPVWDGNEVWLISFGGLLLLSFPRAYAAGFSGFYLPLMIVLWLLIARGIALEWRASIDDPMWRGPADVVFWLSSVLLTVVFGVAVGNIVRGVPLDSSGYYEGLFAWILNPYALLIGALSLVLLTMHGANWLALKTDGVVQERARRAAGRLLAVLISLTVLAALVTFLVQSRMLSNYRAKPWLIVVPLLIVAMLLVLWHARRRTDDLRAFLGSGGLIVALAGSNAVGLYPYLLPSDPHPERGLTITNAASGSGSLTIGIIWLSIGLTLVIVHTVFIYFLFRGKVLLEAGGHY